MKIATSQCPNYQSTLALPLCVRNTQRSMLTP